MDVDALGGVPDRHAGRDTVTETELALDESGKFLALRMKHLCGQGAYVTPAGIGINTNNPARCLPGMYRIPKIDFSTSCVFTNTAPMGPIAAPAARKPTTPSIARSKKPPASPASTARGCAGKSHSAVGDALQNRGHHHV